MNRVDRHIALIGMIAMTLGMIHSPAAGAADLALSDVPLVIDLGVEPNVVVSLDDSGSMTECRVVISSLDESKAETTFAVMTTAVNGLAYDPAVEYQIPIDGNGAGLGEPPFTDAWRDGYNQTSSRVNLSLAFTPCLSSLTNNLTNPDAAQAAYYYKWIGGVINNTSVTIQANFQKIPVGGGTDTGVFDSEPDPTLRADKKERNFAIWYSYYRNRFLAMRSAANLAFRDPALGGRTRIAFQGLWGLGGKQNGPRTDVSLMRLFGAENDSDATAKQGRLDFFNWLNTLPEAGGTPLRYTLDKAGRYYQNLRIDSSAAGHGYTSMSAVNSPWAFQPGTTLSPEFTCRQAFHVLMTDGEWNNDAGRTGNIDNTGANYGSPGTVALPSGATSYVPNPPYQDANSSSLADNAFYYWINDLRTDLANDVPAYMPDLAPHPVTNKVEDNPKNDPATWQHMVNFTVGFAVNGNLTVDDATYNNLLTGATAWPATSGAGRVDDLWHAAINSRGDYVSAQNPRELAQGFANALNAVLARTSSGAAVALNSGTLDANSRLYQARFNSGPWSGQLLAFDINNDGSIATPEAWDAGALLATRVAGNGWDANRHVITFNGTPLLGGIPFRWASLPSGMQDELNKNGQGTPDPVSAGQGQARLEYLRGSAANEGTGNGYRVRSGGKLGDIVNSAPAFVGVPQFSYPDNLESQPYSSFKSANETRLPVVYVGANDGMLHAFDANSGEELFAYVPKIVFPNLTKLTASPYAHRFFVDGPPTVGDVFYSDAWHTVLVGGLRQGGQGIYALDVTDPSTFSETGAASVARWEFTDADLGYTYSRPAIARMHNGRWAAIVGNGYNNTEADGSASNNGNAFLYILDMEDGTVIRKFNTGVGSSADPSGRPNGLTTAAPVDVNGDRLVDYIFAGDLFGNVWKFDVRAGDPGLWAIAYNDTPLFIARDQLGVRQPITGQMEVGLHPQFKTGSSFFPNGGYMIYFGTGKYIETEDNIVTGVQTQSFYGVWDPDQTILPPGFDRSSLLQQQILEEVTATFGSSTFDVRLTSNDAINWRTDPPTPTSGDHLGWFMDLIVQGSGDNKGERQVTGPVLRNGRIIFTTLIPSGSSCVFGGSGFLMELDAANGARLNDPPFDFDNDGTFDLVNFTTIGAASVPSGIRSTGGAPSAPSILDAGGGEEYKYLSGTDAGKLQAVHEKGGGGPTTGGTRESWRQLQ